jgi:dihydrofolate reductase
LPWHYPADLKFFKETTSGNAIAMGFNTWQSIGKPLPKRFSLVLSRANEVEHRPGVMLARSVEEILALAPFLKGDLYVIGGAETYKNFAGAIERWIVTEIPETVADADAFMPRDFLDGFEVEKTVDLDAGLKVKIYERKNASAENSR